MSEAGDFTQPLVTFPNFVQSIYPHYFGPQVTIHIGENYSIPVHKEVLCSRSRYFENMFKKHFQEGQADEAHLVEIKDVLSIRGFEMFLQWLYTYQIIFMPQSPTEEISTAIEFARLLDFYNISHKATERFLAKHIKHTIMSNCAQDLTRSRMFAVETCYHQYFTSEQILSAVVLPIGHPVRAIIAQAMVPGYLRDHDFKFLDEAETVPGFALDVLRETRTALKADGMLTSNIEFRDPMTGELVRCSRWPVDSELHRLWGFPARPAWTFQPYTPSLVKAESEF
ncbi:hypothetical protein BO94DRAFT_574177 [Aspergillus sclerotioniger CBS 115572]|uniref:BTB domain-containing protein n=1 Tax=Aspergillus sclerotioniger CBS 115572 TaxID=1450535 RepID=A0A317WWZ3_9EURO|nr:hypothetical protein BO94DRAFT_574177 [Aspergillus sclerotioniger CBS 115572]PWY90421.1 hypothetical protein BO94DRAFT_574177 [Aspergillus sclerotioniger CBS 115572]